MNNRKMKRYILSLDQGTTSSRAIVFDIDGTAVTSAQREFRQFTPRESWVEHDAEEIWESQLTVAREAISGIDSGADSIAAIGISNQRETTVLWEKDSGKPVGHAIVWQCRRSTDICRDLEAAGHTGLIQERTGLILDAYFSGTKLRWLLDSDPVIAERARKGELLFGTIDSWILWKLTGGKVHATDTSNASRTMMMNLETCEWDEEMLRILEVPRCILPEIKPSVGIFGESVPALFGKAIPIGGIAGDQHAALFGHRAFEVGDVKNTYGTGCFMLMNVGEKPVRSPGGLLSTVAWNALGKTTYALEGSVFMAGALFKWLRDDLELVSDVQEIDRLAEEAGENAGVYLVPAFQGLGSPWWSNRARGTLTGLTRAAKKSHVCRAFIESVAYRTRDVIDVMIADSGYPMGRMRVDGGVTRSDILMQFQADLLGIPVERPASVEATALGAALMAGLGAGIRDRLEDIRGLPADDTVFSPEKDPKRMESLYQGWLETVKKII